MELFLQLVKADFNGEFFGTMCAREVDHDGEVINWPKTVAAVKAWSDGMLRDSGGKNFGNIRDGHSTDMIGKLVEPPQIDDKNQRITVHGVVVDKNGKDKLEAGIFTGLSIGGAYADKKPLGGGVTEYVPKLVELSLVDKPCSPSATLSLVRADGSVMQKHFKSVLVPRQIPGESWLQKSNRQYAHQQAVARGCFMKRQAPDSPRVNPNVSRANDVMTFTDLSNATPTDLEGTGHRTVSIGSAGAFIGGK